MSRELPERPSLAHLKKQAKALVRKVKSGDAEMLSRVRACVRRFADQSDDARLAEWFALHDAQFVIANDYGFTSWRELRVAIAQVTDEDISLVDAEEDPELLLPSHVVSRVRRVAQDLQIHDWSLARCLDHVHDGLAGVIPFERMGLALISEDRQEVELYWARSSRAIRLDRGFRSPLAGSSLEMVMGSGQPRIIDDLRAYLRAHPQSVSSAQIVAEGFCSSLTLPVFVASEPAAFLFFSCVEPRAYLNGHAHALQDSIGSQLSMVLERQKVGGRQTEGGSRELRVKDLRADLRRARQVQREMLKLHDSKLPGLDVAFACEPAGYVGGDIVDLVKFPDQTTLAFLADAMGHGSDAGLVVSAVKGALRAVVAGTRNPGEILGHLNRSMCEMSLTYFATAACMLVNTQERWMDLALAGHYPPILRRTDEVELIEPGLTVAGMPLGIDVREPYPSMRIDFGVGDTLTFFTDGIVEALNPKLHAYGRESIRRIVRENDLQSAGGLLRAIRADFIQHQDGHPTDDDVTLMVVRMT